MLFFPSSCSHRYSWNSIISSFFFSPPCSGPSVVILSCNRNHATGINWAVIAEALSTWTMFNCVHCAGTMTHNFFLPLIPSVLHSNTSISLPFTNMLCRCPNFSCFYKICRFGWFEECFQHRDIAKDCGKIGEAKMSKTIFQIFFRPLTNIIPRSNFLLRYFCNSSSAVNRFTSTHNALLYITLQESEQLQSVLCKVKGKHRYVGRSVVFLKHFQKAATN